MVFKRIKYYIRKFFHYLVHPNLFFKRFKIRKLENTASNYDDLTFLEKMFYLKVGYKLDLQNPKTFNEKMQWLKLYNRNEIYTIMVDKHAAKKYVASIIGGDYVAKEYGVFKHFKDIDFSALPDTFVVKTTHGCGCMLICKDKKSIDYVKESNRFEQSLSDDYFIHCREWPYKNVPHQIIVEEFLPSEKDNEVLPVYKFFCFNGEPYLAQVIINDKQLNETIDYYDMNWNKLNLKQNYPNCKKRVPMPNCLQEMIEVARKLSQGIPFVRCDLFISKGKVYFSEFTFFSDAGFEPFHPKKWDLFLGEMIKLPYQIGEQK